MELIPAIDIRGGQCVRLTQGDYARETVYSDDPAEVAQRWEQLGASRLHVVDLDGAREGRPINQDAIERVLRAISIPVQVGGGLRDLADLSLYPGLGAERIVLGTAALEHRMLVLEALALFRDRVIVALDARDGRVAASGWLRDTSVRATDLARELAEAGVQRFIYTDIARDGTLEGPNLAAVAEMKGALSGRGTAVIASGGVSEVEHLRQLSNLGVEGAIVGKALYTGAIDLPAALAALGAV